MKTKRVAVGLLAAALLPMCAVAAFDHHHATQQSDALKWTAPATYAKVLLRAIQPKRACTLSE